MTENSKTTGLNALDIGMWFSIGSPVITELASECNFDWLLFDLEHGCMSESDILQNLQAVKRKDIELIVRVPAVNAPLIARVLDWGATGIMLPKVSTSQQAEDCLKAMYYPPKGNRGYSGSSRMFGYGLSRPENLKDVKRPLFMAQIENLEGVENADSIARVEGVDTLFVGPSDLGMNLSNDINKQAIAYDEAIQIVGSAANPYQKTSGILVRNNADLPQLKQLGFSCFAVGSDLGILKSGFQAACDV